MKYFSWISVFFVLGFNLMARIDQESPSWIESKIDFFFGVNLQPMIFMLQNSIYFRDLMKLEFISIKFYVQLVESLFFIGLKPTDT